MELMILIFVATATACVGFLLGFLVRALTRRGADSKQAPKQKKGSKPALVKQTKEPITTKKAPKKNWTEVANLWRDRSDGRLIFQIENQYFKRSDELSTREREILLKVVMDFYRWLEPPSAISPKSEAPAIENHPAETNHPQIHPSGKPQEIHALEPAESQNERPPSVNFVTSVLRSEVKVPTPATPSVVTQVDSILQEKIEAANMQKWAIRLMESPTKGMIVLVGLEQYEAIDEVPYERVRRIIRASVAEWERRAEGSDITQ